MQLEWGTNARQITVNSKQIGYEGNYEIMISVPQKTDYDFLRVSVKDLLTNEVVTAVDGNLGIELPEPSIDGVVDFFQRTKEKVLKAFLLIFLNAINAKKRLELQKSLKREKRKSKKAQKILMNNEAIASIRTLLGFFMLMMLLVVVIGALLFAFWIWMIIDCAKRKFRNETDKVVWILVIVLLSVLGAAIYYFAVKINDKKK